MTVAVVALSGRALATSLRRGGEQCDVVDLFADGDTQALARRCIRAAGSLSEGWDRGGLLRAVADLAPSAIAYGAGFEADPALLAGLGAIAPLIGNAPDVVAAVKDPLLFAATLGRLGLPHPETQRAAPVGGDWLVKQIGGSGGGHVRRGAAPAAEGRYAQRRVDGRPVSALFLADGQRASVVGLSEQWSSPTPDAPFRYGGCAGPVSLSPTLADAITASCDAVAAAFRLRGLNSLDLLVDGEGFHVLEINPRPGATLDIFDGAGGISLWRRHRAACDGALPAPVTAPLAARAAAILYAPQRLRVPQSVAWPDWVADQPLGGSHIAAGDPVCTVLSAGATAEAARRAAERRIEDILVTLEAAPAPALA